METSESVTIEFDYFTGKIDHFFAIEVNPIVLSVPSKRSSFIEGEVSTLTEAQARKKLVA